MLFYNKTSMAFPRIPLVWLQSKQIIACAYLMNYENIFLNNIMLWEILKHK